MGKWTTIAEAAIEVLAKRKGGALPDTTLPIRPARENLRTVVDSNTIGGRVSGDEMVPIDSLSGGPSLSARGQKAVDDIVEQMSGPDGFIERLIVDQDNNVIEGAHRVEALRRLGIEQVPITRVVDPTANLDLPKMGEAIKAVGPIHSDHVNQITAHVGDMLAEVGGDPAKVLQEFDLPKGFERFFRAALDSVSPKTLPTDEASRMARAREMGFDMDKPLYRGTTEKGATKATPSFEAGDGIFLNDNPDVAEIFRYPREYGEVLTEHFDEVADEWVGIEPGDLQTLYARMQNPMRLTGDEAQEFTYDTALQSKTIREARAAGHDSIILEDVMEGVGDWQERGTTVVALKPVRAKAAKFDPAKKDSADILAGVGGIAAAGGALSAMGGEARAQEPVNPDDLDPELGMSEQFDRNPLARTGFDPRAVRQLPFKMRGYKAWTSYEDSTNPGLKGIAHGFSRPFSSDDTAMILGIEALPSMDEGGAQLLMHESGHRALRMLNDTEPELVNLVDTLRQPKTDTHSGLDGEEVLMRMLDFFGGNEDRRADTEKFFKQRTGKDIFPVIQENIDTLTQVQAFFQKKLMEQGRNPGSIEFRTPEDIAASPRQNDPAGAALSQQDGFDYGALSNVAEGSNGQRSN
jgi:hypothetical protein